MGAREICGVELEIKPSWGAMRACGMSPALEVPAQPWHLQCRSRLLCLLPSLPEREVVSTLPPAERRVLFKPLKISARATIYPGHFPEPSPPALLPRLPAALALSCLAAFQGTQRAGTAGCRLHFAAALSAPAAPIAATILPASDPTAAAMAGCPSLALGWVVGATCPGRGVTSRLRSPPPPGMCHGGHRDPFPGSPRFGAWAPCPVSRLCCFLRGAGQGSRGHSVPAAFPLIVIF